MSLLQILIISIVQGITEWLPVSSSAHVLLAASFFGYEGRDELLINAVANFGTVASMLIYFRKEIGEAMVGVFALPGALSAKRELSPGERLAMNLLASLPLTMAGLAIARLFIPDEVNEAVRSVQGVAIPLIFFGILLGLADIYGAKTRTINDMPPAHAVLIGAVQVIAAVLPGTSRSGITMTTARALGYTRPDAAKFGMLVGAPVLTAVGLYMIAEFYFGSEVGMVTVTAAEAIAIGVGSAISGLIAIYVLMALVRRMSFLPFVAYRILLGIALLTMMPLPMVAG
ncbi:undecaprenyl-diphosphate phosphatase [Hyphomonas sp.]|jgi:undecaprenyl-diphosphatase|uniref:undecaprenyl-diphosphate phosphatase n=1 Tax=Hyphomonas sp. TaxID=87 RepID=UPI0025B9E6FF|nr:undecaprenyl-diphosphate phosphatase [Hyphomonas sp.]